MRLPWPSYAVILCVAALSAQCEELNIAAASDLEPAMQEVAAQFQKETGTTVKVTYGSSGNFFQQIQNGAPFDMFFSANVDYAKQLDSSGTSEPGTFYEYAKGKIVIWETKESTLDLGLGFRALLDPSVNKIALANPQHAPYGKAGIASMQRENVYDRVKDKLVLGENVAQAMTFVISGSADVGIVPLPLALSPNVRDKGRYMRIPDEDYAAIEQACVVLRSSSNKDAAKRFLAFLKTETVREILQKYGFEVPAGKPAK